MDDARDSSGDSARKYFPRSSLSIAPLFCSLWRNMLRLGPALPTMLAMSEVVITEMPRALQRWMTSRSFIE
jgi:hypothetical protein